MAKKKTASEGNPAPARKRVSKTRKPPVPPAPAQPPLIDTNLAAEAAARMLAAKAKLHFHQEQGAQDVGKETRSFKALKESIQKPASQLPAALGTAFGPNKSNLPTHADNQVAHNQTTGIGRVNVPRRTAG